MVTYTVVGTILLYGVKKFNIGVKSEIVVICRN